MEEIRNLMQEMQTIESRIRDLLDRERIKAADIPDVEIAETEEASIVLNNIDLLDAAMRSAKGVSYVLQDYVEVESK